MLKRLLYLALLLPLTMLAQISPNRPIQAYQSTSFSVTPTDFSQSVVYPLNGTANITVTLLSTAPPNGQCIGLRQEGSGGVIINANGVTATGNLTIQPASSVLPTSANICSDGATYKVDQSGQVSGGSNFYSQPQHRGVSQRATWAGIYSNSYRLLWNGIAEQQPHPISTALFHYRSCDRRNWQSGYS